MPTNARVRRLSTGLRQLREAAGLSVAAVVAELDIAASSLYRWESGGSVPNTLAMRGLLGVYGVSGANTVRAWIGLAKAADTEPEAPWLLSELPAQLASYVELELEATDVRTYGGVLVPGLLQTPAYAEEVVRRGLLKLSRQESDRRLAARRLRQERLERPGRPTVAAIVDELALTRPVAPGIIREQAEYLEKLSKLPEISVRVLPASAGLHPGHTSLAILSFADTGQRIADMDTILSEVIVDAEDDLRRAVSAWDALDELALDADASMTLLRNLRTP